MTKISKEDKELAEKTLRRFISEDTVVYTKLNHVSASGMMRVIDVYVAKNNEILRLTWSAAIISGYSYNRKHEGIEVRGAGFDAGYDVVDAISRKLFGAGYKVQHRWL